MKILFRRHVILLSLAGLVALLAGVGELRAQQSASAADTPPVVVLFVGNSYTFGGLSAVEAYNKASVTTDPSSLPADGTTPADHPGRTGVFGGVPGIFKKMADEAGVRYEVHMEVYGGKPLEFHYKSALPIIAQAKWQLVVLQGYSTEALPVARGGKPDNFVANAALLEQAVHHANPAAKVYLYETFPRSDQVYPEKAAYHGSTVNAMAADLHTGYQRAFTRGRFEAVVPAGDAWVKVFAAGLAQLNPYLPPEPGKFNLWAGDNHHASVYGSYLNALVFFGQFTGKDASTLGANEQAAHDLGIPPETAVKLQKIADETVKAARHG